MTRRILEVVVEWNQVARVVVPLDLEDPDEQGVRLATAAATTPDGVHVVYVLPELEPSLLARIDDAVRVTNAHAALVSWLAERGFPSARPHVRVGHAANVIASVAGAVGADLLVIPSHGRRGVSRALLGSVAERVVRLAPCPVLVLKPVTASASGSAAAS